MERPLLREQTPAEFFKELVEQSLARQHMRTGDLTEYYLVNLLCRYVRIDFGVDDVEYGQPLAIRLARALESGGAEQRARLRSLGDFTLFTSGFFSARFMWHPGGFCVRMGNDACLLQVTGGEDGYDCH